MRKYIDYKNEITDSELFDGLVGFGLFAEKIPNFLTSADFLNFVSTLPFPINDKPKDYIRYSNMRNINIPRHLAIPEPFAYANQCKVLSNNWSKIKKHFEQKTDKDEFKISRIHLRKMVRKSELFEMNYKNFDKDGSPDQDIVIRSKYIAFADISNCFPSIYSHSIAWSLVGKIKSKLHKSPLLWYNQLDFYTRNVKFGETNGVLIGPHSSNLISEIVLVTVDKELTKHGFKFIRNIDDYNCYVNSYEEAERFFLCLSEELKNYELFLNNKKSKIIPLPQASVKNWVTKLNHFNFTNTYIVNNKEAIRVKELKGFLDFAIELMLEEDSDASIINYAIKILSNKHLDRNAKDYFIKKIHHLVLLYPYLIHLLEKQVFEPNQIDKSVIKTIAEDIYAYGVKKKVYEACSYALYWAIKYGFEMDTETIKKDSINSMDCIFLMLSYLYDKKYHRKLYLKEYKDLAMELKKNDFDRYWLFIYETLTESHLPDNYGNMKRLNLTFIKPEFN